MFFVNAKATTGIYTYRHTLSRHDALPIYVHREEAAVEGVQNMGIEPRAKYRSLRRVAAFSQQHANLQLLKGNRRQVQIVGVYAVGLHRLLEIGRAHV